jgi:hypothetical protein
MSQSVSAVSRPWSALWQALELSRDSIFGGATRYGLKLGQWANDTAIEFGALVSGLLAPAVVSAYLIAAWSITADMGISGQFMVSSGPFSNWMVWMGIAISLNVTAAILRRHARRS